MTRKQAHNAIDSMTVGTVAVLTYKSERNLDTIEREWHRKIDRLNHEVVSSCTDWKDVLLAIGAVKLVKRENRIIAVAA